MKDFTQAKSKTTQEKVDLKCNKCSTMVRAYGVEVGDTCTLIPNSADHNVRGGTPCGGKYLKVDAKTADEIKRRTDGAA